MTVLRVIEKSPDGNRWRFVTAVTETMIKTVDNHILMSLDKIEIFCMKNGICNTVFGKPVWDGGLRPYLKSDNTINPQWLRKDTGASVLITGIRGIIIRKK